MKRLVFVLPIVAIVLAVCSAPAIAGQYFGKNIYHIGLHKHAVVKSPTSTPRTHRNVYTINPPAKGLRSQYADGPNLYQYVRSNPIRHTDSSGLAVDPGKDCGLRSRSKHGGPKKPHHYWLAGREGKKALWDFGPNKDWMDKKFGKGKWNPSWCSWGRYCPGSKNYHDDYYVKHVDGPHDTTNNLKLKWDFGPLVNKLKAGPKGIKGKKCKCVTCGDIKACLDAVETQWDERRYEYVWRNCVGFILDAMGKCCLRE